MSVSILPLSHHQSSHHASTLRPSRLSNATRNSRPEMLLKYFLPLLVIIFLLVQFDVVHISPLYLILQRSTASSGSGGGKTNSRTLLASAMGFQYSTDLSSSMHGAVDSPSWHEGGESSQNGVHRPLVISGPSGVGKGTLINKLVEFYNHHEDDHTDNNKGSDKDFFGFSVSHTTRNARPGEVDGIHYHFSQKDDVLKQIEQGKFIEHAEVHGNLYGTSYSAVQSVVDTGKICILDIDVNGAKNIKMNTSLIKPYFIFVAPPSMTILEKRLRDRGTETEEAIQKRTANAQREMDYGTAFGNFDEVLVNDDLESAFLRLRQILEEWYPHLNQVPVSVQDSSYASEDWDLESDLEL